MHEGRESKALTCIVTFVQISKNKNSLSFYILMNKTLFTEVNVRSQRDVYIYIYIYIYIYMYIK